ncbi:MAG: N-acetylglucosamine kinase [Gemmatimonadota bacterium]
MSFYIGIDGGGTRTTALVTDENGTELARLDGEPGLVDVLDPEAGAHVLAGLASAALAQAKVNARASVLVCALAGAAREPERTRLEERLAAQGVAVQVHVLSDFEAAVQDAFGNGSGILVIAGTGSSAWGRNQDGRAARAGGWGQLLGDEGSGYALGLAALQNCVRAHDGRGTDERWIRLVLAHTAVATPEALVRWAAGASKADIAALARIVFEAADQRVAGAHVLIEEAATELARHVGALYERLNPWSEPPTIALSGGLVSPERPLRAQAIRQIERLGLKLPIFEDRIDGARGAAALARRR